MTLQLLKRFSINNLIKDIKATNPALSKAILRRQLFLLLILKMKKKVMNQIMLSPLHPHHLKMKTLPLSMRMKTCVQS